MFEPHWDQFFLLQIHVWIILILVQTPFSKINSIITKCVILIEVIVVVIMSGININFDHDTNNQTDLTQVISVSVFSVLSY